MWAGVCTKYCDSKSIPLYNNVLIHVHMLERFRGIYKKQVKLKALCQYISSNWLLYLTPDAVRYTIA